MPRAVAGSVPQCFHVMMRFLIVSMTTKRFATTVGLASAKPGSHYLQVFTNGYAAGVLVLPGMCVQHAYRLPLPGRHPLWRPQCSATVIAKRSVPVPPLRPWLRMKPGGVLWLWGLGGGMGRGARGRLGGRWWGGGGLRRKPLHHSPDHKKVQFRAVTGASGGRRPEHGLYWDRVGIGRKKIYILIKYVRVIPYIETLSVSIHSYLGLFKYLWLPNGFWFVLYIFLLRRTMAFVGVFFIRPIGWSGRIGWFSRSSLVVFQVWS